MSVVEFQSPRFADDPLLVAILNDPDSGTLKLQPGSPPGSVIPLQQALCDLGWNTRYPEAEFADADPLVFVDGQYGRKTTAAVLAFKQHYDIRFPPDQPGGLIDGLAGPRTFAKLDPQCVLYDEAADASETRAVELGIELENLARRVQPIDGTSGTVTGARNFANRSEIFYKRGVGAYEIHGPLQEAYSLGVGGGGATGPLGFPTSDEHDDDTATVRVQDFEHGTLRLDPSNNAVDVLELIPASPEEDPVF